MKKAIIVFQKYPEPGKVKTRLAKTIGKEKAALLYGYLVAHTHQQLKPIQADIVIYHDGKINYSDYPESRYFFDVQEGKDLGEKMGKAFSNQFSKGYDKILIIGTDCYELKSRHLEEAFNILEERDMVIGPALDGGYYLLGFRAAPAAQLFEGIAWSTASVLEETLNIAHQLGYSVKLLEMLNDVDRWADLGDLKDILDDL
ncbi:MAG: TIGR04282 family arsenosugar biosynthesis glycosyltransferase, partial [Cyclobacteriaceae bacterium]